TESLNPALVGRVAWAKQRLQAVPPQLASLPRTPSRRTSRPTRTLVTAGRLASLRFCPAHVVATHRMLARATDSIGCKASVDGERPLFGALASGSGACTNGR